MKKKKTPMRKIDNRTKDTTNMNNFLNIILRPQGNKELFSSLKDVK
jgi:hypothetical protein